MTDVLIPDQVILLVSGGLAAVLVLASICSVMPACGFTPVYSTAKLCQFLGMSVRSMAWTIRSTRHEQRKRQVALQTLAAGPKPVVPGPPAAQAAIDAATQAANAWEAQVERLKPAMPEWSFL